MIKKNFSNSRLKAENFQKFEITRTIYSNSERSEQFLVTECFFKVEMILEQREFAFLSPSNICENLNFSREIQNFANFAG